MVSRKYGINRIHFYIQIIKAKIFGLTSVVRYLRNPNPEITVSILRAFGAQIGDGATFKRCILIDNSFEDEGSTGDFRNLVIGKNVYIGDSVYFDLANKITIGNNAVISGKVSLVTHADCSRSNHLKKLYPRESASIFIGEGAWIAFNATILHGVRIEEHAVVGAHALVIQDIKSLEFHAGVPAKKIKTLSENKH